jgi:hypothetical protein
LKTNYLILLAVAVSGTLFAILAPANIKDKLIGVATFATNERQCVNACLEVHHSLRAKVHQFKTYF